MDGPSHSGDNLCLLQHYNNMQSISQAAYVEEHDDPCDASGYCNTAPSDGSLLQGPFDAQGLQFLDEGINHFLCAVNVYS